MDGNSPSDVRVKDAGGHSRNAEILTDRGSCQGSRVFCRRAESLFGFRPVSPAKPATKGSVVGRRFLAFHSKKVARVLPGCLNNKKGPRGGVAGKGFKIRKEVSCR